MIRDDAFIGRSTSSDIPVSKFTGIANPRNWDLNQIAELIGAKSQENELFPSGILVKFELPNNVFKTGKIASKCGDEYLIEAQPGESYLIPIGKLQKLDNSVIAEVVRQEFCPQIKVLGEKNTNNKHIASIEYVERHPSDQQLINWSGQHYPDLKLIDAIDLPNKKIDLIFEMTAAEDIRPQGGDQVTRGRPLSSEPIEGTGVTAEAPPLTGIDETAIEKGIKVEMGEHTTDKEIARQIAIEHLAEDPEYYVKLEKMEKKSFLLSEVVPTTFSLSDVVSSSPTFTKKAQKEDKASAYQDLDKAAKWALAKFNDSNQDAGYYAIPKDIVLTGTTNNLILQQAFELKKRDGDALSDLYMLNNGKIITAEEQSEQNQSINLEPVRGYIEVNSDADIPIVMLSTPFGMQSAQKYNLHFTAEIEYDKDELSVIQASRRQASDVCAALADTVLSEHGGYSAAAHKDFEARLTKLAVDPKAKKYWSEYFGDYGKMFTRKIPRKNKKLSQLEYIVTVDYEPHTLPDHGGITEEEMAHYEEEGYPDEFYDQKWKIDFEYEPQQYGGDGEILGENVSFYSATNEDTGEEIPIEEFYKRFNKNKQWLEKDFFNWSRDINEPEYFDVSAHKKTAIDENAKKYWIEYFGSGVYNDSWYGELLVRDIPRKKIAGKTADSDYAAFIKKTKGGKYEVKSKSNPEWSGGTYDTKEEAEERLSQVEMFKHMKGGSTNPDWINAAIILYNDFDKIAVGRSYKRPKHMRPKIKQRQYPSSGPDLSSLHTLATWAVNQAKYEGDWELQDLIRHIALGWIQSHPGYFDDTIGPEEIGEAFYYGIRDNASEKKAVEKFLKGWEKRRQSWQFKQLSKERELKKYNPESSQEKQDTSPGMRDIVNKMLESEFPTESYDIPQEHLKMVPPEPTQEQLESSYEIPGFEAYEEIKPKELFSRARKIAADIKKLIDKDPDDLSPEELNMLIEYYTEEAKAEEKAKESKYYEGKFKHPKPTSLEEALKEPTYHPPKPYSDLEEMAKRQKLVENEVNKIRDALKQQIPVTNKMSVLDWVIPKYEDTKDGGKWYQYTLADALWLTSGDKDERQELYNMLIDNFPEYYVAYLYSTLPNEKSFKLDPEATSKSFTAEKAHKEIEKLYGYKIPFPKEIGLPNTPRPLKRVEIESYLSQRPDYKEWIEEYLAFSKENKLMEEEESKGEIKDVKEFEHIEKSPQIKTKTYDPEEFIGKYFPPYKHKIWKEEESEPLPPEPEYEERPLGEEVKKEFRPYEPVPLESREYMQQRPSDIELLRSLGSIYKNAAEEEWEAIPDVDMPSEVPSDPSLEEKPKVTNKAVELAKKLLDPDSRESKLYQKFLNWIPLTKRVFNNKKLYESAAGLTIGQILELKDGTEILARIARSLPQYEEDVINGIYFVLNVNKYLTPEIRREKRKKTLKETKELEGEGKLSPVKFVTDKQKAIQEARNRKKKKEKEQKFYSTEKYPIVKYKKPKEYTPTEEEKEPTDVMYKIIPAGFGPYSGKPLHEALRATKDDPEAFEELCNMLRMNLTKTWLKFYKRTYGPEEARREEARIKNIRATDEEFGEKFEDLTQEQIKYLDLVKGRELAEKVYNGDIPVPEIFDIANKQKESGEPGLMKYLIYHFKNMMSNKKVPNVVRHRYKEIYSIFNEYIRAEKLGPEIDEWSRKKKENLEKLDFLIEEGNVDDWWFKKRISEAYDIIQQASPEEKDRFKRFIHEHYLDEWHNFLKNKKAQEKIELEHGKIKTEKQKPDIETIRKQKQEQHQKAVEGIPETTVPVTEHEELMQKIPSGTTMRIAPSVLKEKMEEQVPEPEPKQKQQETAAEKLKRLLKYKYQLEQEQKALSKQQMSPTMESKEPKVEFPKMTPSQQTLVPVEKKTMKEPFNQPKMVSKGHRELRDASIIKIGEERNMQPARNMNKFNVNRIYSTSSSEDSGYILMELSWEPELFEDMSPQNIQHQIISHIKSLEGDKYFHDFGIMGKPKLIEFDQDAGVARVKVRCSETRGVPSLTYDVKPDENLLPLTGIR